MITKYEKANKGKLLVAVLAMAMIIAGCAIVFSDENVDATNAEFTSGISEGVYTLDGDKSFTLDSTIDTSSGITSNALQISLGEGVDSATLTLTMNVTDSVKKMFEGVDITVDKGVTLKVVMTDTNGVATGNDSFSAHVFQDLDIINNGTIILSQVPAGQSYYNSDVETPIELTLGEGASFIIDAGNGFSGVKVTTAANSTIDFKSTTSNKASLSLAEGSVIAANSTISADVAATFVSFMGNADVKGTINAPNSEVRLYNNAAVTVEGNIDAYSFTGTGSLETSGTGSITSVETPADGITVDNVSSGDDNLGLRGTLLSDYTVVDDNYLSSNLTIAEGVTLTISTRGSLDLGQYNLTVNGTLAIERNGTIIATLGGSIVLGTGSIQNSGTIGVDKPVTITATNAADQTVQMQGVSGVELSLTRSGSNYNLNVSGDVTRISGVSNPSLTLTGVTINADMTINNRVSFTATDVTVGRNVALTVNGTATDVGITLENGASFTAAGAVKGTIGALAGVVGDNNTIYTATDKKTQQTTPTTVKLDGNANGITVSVGRVTLANDDGTSDIWQRFYVTGTAGLVSGTNTNPIEESTIEFTGSIYVVDTFFVPKDITVAGGAFDVATSGTIQLEDGNVSVITYNGAKYIVETESNNITAETTYYTSFDAAMGAIATAMNGEVYVSGDFMVNQSYTIGAEQYIILEDNNEYVITVGKDAVITINEDGSIDNTVIGKIEGRVIVNDGGVYSPVNTAEKTIYEVTSTNNETGVITYSGFGVALADAESGDVIEIVGTAIVTGNMTIPSGVTVNVDDNVDLTVTGNVTVAEDGKLNLGTGSVFTVGTAGKTNTINNAGTIDATDGSITGNADATAVNLYSTGSVIVGSEINSSTSHITPNSAYYTNLDSEVVYTSVANAAAYATENVIQTIKATGTFSEAGDVNLDGVNLEITGATSVVTLGNVTLDGAQISIASGSTGATYSANVTALSGAGDAAVNSTVSVTKTNATIASTSTLNSQGVDEYSMTLSAINGNVTVSAGTVEYVGNDFNVSRTNSLTVSSGATLVIAANSNSNDIDITTTNGNNNDLGMNYLVNNGTIEVTADVTISNSIILGGTVIVDDGGSITVSNAVTLTIAGTLTVSAEENNEGTMTVNGVLEVGTVPDMLGASGTVNGTVGLSTGTYTGYVIVYSGSSVAGANFDTATAEAVSTTYTINGIQFATVYTVGDVTYNVLDSKILTLRNLETTVNNKDITIEWYNGDQKISTGNVGDYAELSTEIDYAGVDFVISVGPGLSVYIDDVKVGSSANLAIGQHTITVYVSSGYEGTPSVTVNGSAVTGGSFEVTADMLDGNNLIYATGATPIDYTQGGSSSDDGMGIVEILLVILVVVVVILAIIVVLRMMRS